MAYEIEFSPDGRSHLKQLTKRQQNIIVDEIEAQLLHQPERETAQRKRLRPNPLAPWELRVGEFRVFYDVDLPSAKVIIVAVGRKTHSRLIIGNEEVFL